MNSKIKSASQIKAISKKLRKKGKKIVFTNGCFDLLHAGHVFYLRKARKAGDVLIIALNSDASVRKIKGPSRPVNHERDRAEVLSALEMVDFVTIFNDETPLKEIKAIKPHVLVKGADWKMDEIAGAKEVQSWGGKVMRISLLQGRSTSRLIKSIKTK